MASWYYLSNGQQAGPVEEDVLRQMIQAGRIGPAELVWSDGMPGWLPVASVPGLAAFVVPSPGTSYAAPPPPYAPPSGYGAGGFVAPQPYAMAYAGPVAHRNGTTAVGVISIIWGGLFVLCAGAALVSVLTLPHGRLGRFGPIDRLVPFVSLALHASLVASGIGTLMRRQWAKVLVWVITGPSIALYLYNVVTSLSRHHPLASQASDGGYYFGLLFAAGMGIFWPLFLIHFYQRPAVKQEFEGASTPWGPGSQGGGYRY